MNYIKNNKVFIFLFSILLFITAALSYRLLVPETNNNFQQGNGTQSATTQISNFYGHFSDEKLAIELSWNVVSGNKTLSKLVLFCNDVELVDVTNSYSISLSAGEYDISTGNNKFDLVATFSDGSELSKSKYVYTDEAYAIKVNEQHMDNKSVYTLTYFYDKRKPVNIPTVSISGINGNFAINYVNSETISEEGNVVNMKITYELLYNDVKPGNYSIPLTFSFLPQYNISVTHNSSFQVSAATNNGEDSNTGNNGSENTDNPENGNGNDSGNNESGNDNENAEDGSNE